MTLSTSHDDDDEKKDENTLDPNKAMKNLARKFSKKHYNLVFAGVDMYPHIEYEGVRNGNTAYFNVVVEVRWWGTPNTGKIDWKRVHDDRLQSAWNEFTKEMMRAHEQEVGRLRAAISR